MMDYGIPHSRQSHDMAASFDSTRHRRLKRMQQACSKFTILREVIRRSVGVFL